MGRKNLEPFDPREEYAAMGGDGTGPGGLLNNGDKVDDGGGGRRDAVLR
jgi:hypothetical protein